MLLVHSTNLTPARVWCVGDAGLQADDAPPAHTHGGIIQTFSIWDLPLLALGVPILLLARALNVFSISALANLGRPPHLRISLRMQAGAV